MLTSHVLSAFLENYPQYVGLSSLDGIGRDLVDFLCPYGVKLGGGYLHFKGKTYIAVEIVRDCNDWEGERLVKYVEAEDARHVATRKVSEFLGMVSNSEYSGPRFKLVE